MPPFVWEVVRCLRLLSTCRVRGPRCHQAGARWCSALQVWACPLEGLSARRLMWPSAAQPFVSLRTRTCAERSSVLRFAESVRASQVLQAAAGGCMCWGRLVLAPPFLREFVVAVAVAVAVAVLVLLGAMAAPSSAVRSLIKLHPAEL